MLEASVQKWKRNLFMRKSCKNQHRPLMKVGSSSLHFRLKSFHVHYPDMHFIVIGFRSNCYSLRNFMTAPKPNMFHSISLLSAPFWYFRQKKELLLTKRFCNMWWKHIPITHTKLLRTKVCYLIFVL